MRDVLSIDIDDRAIEMTMDNHDMLPASTDIAASNGPAIAATATLIGPKVLARASKQGIGQDGKIVLIVVPVAAISFAENSAKLKLKSVLMPLAN